MERWKLFAWIIHPNLDHTLLSGLPSTQVSLHKKQCLASGSRHFAESRFRLLLNPDPADPIRIRNQTKVFMTEI
jgi:hypothetical protein